MIKKDITDNENFTSKEITFKTDNKNGFKNIDNTFILKKESLYTLSSSPCKTRGENFLESENS